MGAERWSALRLRLKALLHRRRLDRDLDEELQFHLDMRARQGMAGGAPPEAADTQARRTFGNRNLLKEALREMWSLGSIEILWQDIRYSFRTLRKTPGFTTVAILALALGIGANTAIFSVVNAVILRPLPYRDPGKLVILWGNVRRAKVERRGASYPDFVDWRSQGKSFVDMAAFDGLSFTLTGVDEPERIQGEIASASYFPLLGVGASVGRTFLPSEDEVPGRNPVAILSDGLWRRRYGADPSILGKPIQLNNRSYVVIGVMPAGFLGLSDAAEVWIPFTMSGSAEDLAERGNRGFQVLARLKPGVSRAQSQAEIDAICRGLERAYPSTNEGRGVEVAALDQEMVGPVRNALLVLLGAVALVLLIACANVANLLLARSEARQHEIALRVSLGAGRMRLWRQLLTESCMLSLLGAIAGLLVATVGIRALMATSPITFPSFVHPGIDPQAAAFTVLVSLACGVLMGFAPILHARFARLHNALKETSTRGSSGRLTQRFRQALVVAEVALTLVLLIGAGLLIRSFRELSALHPGFDPSHLLTLTVSLPRLPQAPPGTPSAALNATGDAKAVVSTRELLNRLRAIPSVQSASATTDIPLSGNSSAVFYTAEGQPPVTAQNIPRAYIHRVTPEFFDTLRTRFIAGRTFTENELSGNSDAIIVSENVVKRFWPGQDPINKRVRGGGPSSRSPWLRIVGVVEEMKYRGLPSNPTADPDLYLPFTEQRRNVSLLIRTTLEPGSLTPAVRQAVREADKTIPIYDLATMDERISQQTARNRFTSWLMGIFSAAALLLAMIGLYGVMSYAVARRTQEIGIRIALGASRASVLNLIVGQALPLILIGIAGGLVAAFGLTRLIATLLYGVTSTDSATFVAVPILLIVVALAACLIPAGRASRVDPIRALRYE